jgi:hypothetical protein
VVGTPATAMGWGNTLGQPLPGGVDYPEALQEVEIPIVSNAYCNLIYGIITDEMVCAGVFKGGKGPCQGDSGSPLVYYDETGGLWRQVGIISFGFGCAGPHAPGVHMRVSRYAEWIDEVLHPFIATHWAYIPGVLETTPLPTEIQNGDFEAGPGSGWTESSTQDQPLILSGSELPDGITPHSGDWVGALGGSDFNFSGLSQELHIPDGVQALEFQHWVTSVDGCGFDFFSVVVDGIVISSFSLCVDSVSSGWVEESVDISDFAGQDVLLELVVSTDVSLISTIYLDDVGYDDFRAGP